MNSLHSTLKATKLAAMMAGALLVGSTTITAQNASLTVLHGVPGLSGPVDVFANGGQLFSFDYGDQEGPLSLPAATYAIDIQLNGQSILSANVPLAANTNYSAIAHLDAGGTPKISLFTNDVKPVAAGDSRLVVRHTAAAPAVDVQLDQNGSQVAKFNNLANGGEVQADVAEGQYEASLFVAGTNTRAFGPASVALEEGYFYSVYAVGDVTQPNFRLLIQRESLASRVTVVHGIPGLPAPVDVLVDGTKAFSFDFKDVQGPLVLPPGTYQLDVQLQGTSVLASPATVEAGDNVTIVAHLDASAQPKLSVFANDVSPTQNSDFRLTVRHLAAAPAVDIGLDGGGNRIATIPNVSNGGEFVGDVNAGGYEVSIFPAGSNQSVFGPAPFKTAAGLHYMVHAIGDLNGGSFDLLVVTQDLEAAVPGEVVTMMGGTGCGPTIAAAPSSFDFGDVFSVNVSGGDANGMSVLSFGDSITSLGGANLPIDLSNFGANGCFLNANVIVSHPVMLDGQGNGGLSLVVPRATFGQLPSLYFTYATATTTNTLGWKTTGWLEVSAR